MKKLLLVLLLFSFNGLLSQSLMERYKSEIINSYNENKIFDFEELSTIEITSINDIEYDFTYVPCVVNGVFEYFILDTGFSEGISINTSVFNKILKTKNVLYEDYLGDMKMLTAFGGFNVVKVVVMNKVLIGGPSASIRLNNVLTIVYEGEDGPFLLGQDVLRRFSAITIDNINNSIIFKK